jgi:predicted nucleic acid-binding Zn finger protein
MVKEESEIEALENICEEIKESGKVTGENLTRLAALFGSRFQKAWEAVRGNRVKKYIFKPSERVIWIVVGRERDYLVMPDAGFCSCDDFYFHVMSRKAHLCYHLIGQKLAESLGWYDEIEENDDMYDFLMNEWKKAIP